MINGVDMGAIGAGTNAIDRGTQTAAAINSKTSQTGVTASANTSTGVVSLTAADGRNITVSTTTAGGTGTGLVTTTTGAAPAAVGAIAASAFKINGVDIGAVTAGGTVAIQGANVAAAIQLKFAQTGVSAAADAAGLVTLTTAAYDGRGIEVSGDITNTGLSTRPSSISSNITLSTNGDKGIVIGGTLGAASTGQTGNVGFNASVLSSSGGVDLSTAAGSIAALSVLDKAINTVTDSRASMGAYQNRLTASVANLEITSMNLQASRSRILDTDYAKETTKLAKAQIIQQAATAMLAQANQSSQSVLSLLK
jgi:flagellin